METFYSIFQGMIRYFFEGIMFSSDVFGPPEKDHALRAEFDSGKELLSIWNNGICVNGKHSISEKLSHNHGVVISPSGGGKTSVVILPTILTSYASECSFIIHDPSGDLFKSAGFLRSKGWQTLILNPANPRQSIGFNVLHKIKDQSDIGRIASMLIKTALPQSKDPFWENSGISLLSCLISLCLQFPREYHTLANVRELVKSMAGDSKEMDKIVAEYATDKIYSDYRALRAYDTKLLTSIISTVLASLTLFENSDIARVTSIDTLDFSTLRKKKIALFIQTKVADQSYLSVLTSLFFELLFRSFMERPIDEKERSVFVIIDEAASGLKIPSLESAIANVRKSKVSILLAIQHPAQLESTYNKATAETILGNCYTKIFLPGQPFEVAQSIEKVLGEYEYTDDKGNYRIRPLLTASEIRMLPMDNAIVIIGNHKPILTKLIPFYKRWWLRRRTQMPMPLVIGGAAYADIHSIA